MELFEYLLGGLPDEYSTTRAALDAQVSLDVTEKLLVVQNYQDQLRATTSASTSTPTNVKALAAKGELRLVLLRYKKLYYRSAK